MNPDVQEHLRETMKTNGAPIQVEDFFKVSYYCVSPTADLKVLAELMQAVFDFDVRGYFDDGVWELTGQTRHEATPYLNVSLCCWLAGASDSCCIFTRQFW
jgi:hypothetical protein